MNVFKVLFISFLSIFLLSGCGGGGASSSSGGSNGVNIVLPVDEITVSTSNEAKTINVRVVGSDNTFYQTGKVHVKYPDAINDRDIGSFVNDSVDVVNGIASFTYIAPDNIGDDVLNIAFEFYHEDDPSTTKQLIVKVDSVVPDLTLNIPNPELYVTQNSQSATINVNVYDQENNPYSNGNVKIVYPDDVQSGRDIGQFASNEVALVNGIASFNYTGPHNIDQNNSDIVFKFYHEENPTKFVNYTVKIDNSQIVLTSYKLDIDYGSDVNMNLESSKQIHLTVKDIDDVLLDDSKISSIKIDLKNPRLGTLEDVSGHTGSTLTVSDQNDALVNIKSNTISGIMPLEVTAVFIDANGESRTISEVFNILVLSGPPSAISLNYVSTSQEEGIAKFKEKWVVTVTDKYNNFVNTKPSVSMGLISGFTQSSATTTSNNQNYLYYESGGTINATTDIFSASSSAFSNVDFANDTLVTFGDGYTYNASGKWDITSNSSSSLRLVDNYEGSTTSGLGFAIGHNYRQITCEVGQEAVANVEPADGNFILDEDTGTLVLDLSYDYYMVGKSVMLWVNLIGRDNTNNKDVKIGEAQKITFRANGLEGISQSYSAGSTGVVRIPVRISGTVEYYRNANFSATVTAPEDLDWSLFGSYMNLNDVSSCVNGGVGYVDVKINTPAPTGGTISLTNVLPTSEF